MSQWKISDCLQGLTVMHMVRGPTGSGIYIYKYIVSELFVWNCSQARRPGLPATTEGRCAGRPIMVYIYTYI